MHRHPRMTEVLRVLSRGHVDLAGAPDDDPPIPPWTAVWRSVRAGADMKARKSRRTLAVPRRCVEALEAQRRQEEWDRAAAGSRRQEYGLVFTSKVGTPLDPSQVRRDFRRAIRDAAGRDPTSGLSGNCATALCRCSRAAGCRWRRSHAWSATAAQQRPNWSTANRFGRCSSMERR